MASLFDSIDDDITLANESNFDFERTDPFSISFRIKSSSASTQTIIAKLDSGPAFRGWELLLLGGGAIRLNMISTAASNALRANSTSAAPGDGSWHHVVFTYDGSSDISGVNFYVDSVSGTSAVTNTLSATILNNVSVTLGSDVQGFFLNGTLDEVLVYDVELNQSQVTRLHLAKLKGMGEQISPNDRVLDLRMDDGPIGSSGDGVIFVDRSGNSNDGTGNHGGNASGLTFASGPLSYPGDVVRVIKGSVLEMIISGHRIEPGIREGLQFGLR